MQAGGRLQLQTPLLSSGRLACKAERQEIMANKHIWLEALASIMLVMWRNSGRPNLFYCPSRWFGLVFSWRGAWPWRWSRPG